MKEAVKLKSRWMLISLGLGIATSLLLVRVLVIPWLSGHLESQAIFVNILGYAITFGIFFFPFLTKIKPAHGGALLFMDSRMWIDLNEGTWWIPLRWILFNVKIFDMQEVATPTGDILGMSKDNVEMRGKAMIPWKPKSPSCLAGIESTTILDGLKSIVKRFIIEEMGKRDEDGWREKEGVVRAADQKDPLEELGEKIKNGDDLAQMAARYGIEIFKQINVEEILPADKDYIRVRERVNKEKIEREAERIEIENVNARIKEIADNLVLTGMPREEAARQASIIYQSQVGKAKRFSIEGGGDFTQGMALRSG